MHKESTAWPQNHFVAAEIALKMGDIYSLFDAVEGAILSAFAGLAYGPHQRCRTVGKHRML